MKKKTIHENFGEDLWEIGICMFAEKDVVNIRAEAQETLRLKSDVRKCILEDIHASSRGADVDQNGHKHLEYMPVWQRHVRSKANNLGLKMSR